MTQDTLVMTIDWHLGEIDFRTQIQRMIATAMAQDKVIVLPILPGFDNLMLLLTQVHCDHCNAPCCKSSPSDGLLTLAPSEFKALVEKYGAFGMVPTEFGGAIKMPCRFLHRGRCIIYDGRPLICMVFPLQPGGAIGTGMGDRLESLSVASSCPEARRIAKALYLIVWRMRQKAEAIGREEMGRLLNGKGEKTER